MKTSKFYDLALTEAQARDADLPKALRLLSRAYKKGDPRAAYALGTWYLHGMSSVVPKSLRKAISYLREATESDHADAAYDLAVCYEKGMGVRRSETRAVALYLKAALLGDAQSIYHVGRCYQHGLGVKRDRRIAAVWYARAAEMGFSR